jgi:hypothetical protein
MDFAALQMHTMCRQHNQSSQLDNLNLLLLMSSWVSEWQPSSWVGCPCSWLPLSFNTFNRLSVVHPESATKVQDTHQYHLSSLKAIHGLCTAAASSTSATRNRPCTLHVKCCTEAVASNQSNKAAGFQERLHILPSGQNSGGTVPCKAFDSTLSTSSRGS